MKFTDVPQFIDDGHYRVDVGWTDVEGWLERQFEIGLDIDPDFQRAHVWDEQKQVAYVEFCLRGGRGSNEIRFNCVGWMNSFEGPFVLVDGKQRLQAVRKFMNNEIRAFGLLYNEFEDKLRWHRTNFSMVVNSLKTRKEVLQWYLDINTGGVVHTKEEIEKVRKLLELEK